MSHGIRAGPDLTGQSGSLFGKGLDMDFEGKKVAVGAPAFNNNTGYVEIYDYDDNANTWTSNVIINGPHTQSFFGHAVSMKWNGDRVAISANAASNVYIYDYNGGWSLSNVISNVSSTNFGHAISLAADAGNRLCIGTPDENMIYIYEETPSGGFVETYSNVGTDLVNELPVNEDGTVTVTVNSEYNGYGFSVQMAAFGEHVIVGAPGSRLTQIDSTNSTATTVYNTSIPGTPDISGTFGSYQIGMVRILTCPIGGSWSSGVTQHGSVIKGTVDFNVYLGDTGKWGSELNSFPAAGFKTQITPDGQRIAFTSPELKKNDTGLVRLHGGFNIYDFDDTLEEWVTVYPTVIGRNTGSRTGYGMTLSYDGGRISVTELNYVKIQYIYDWSGSLLYDVEEPVDAISHGFPTSGTSLIGENVVLKSGNYSAISAPLVDKVIVFKHNLTALFEGNSLFDGYIKANSIYIGANDDSLIPKRLFFGGTRNDNIDEASTIQSRTYAIASAIAGDTAIGSELLLNKSNIGNAASATNPDRIRLKARAIQLDTHYNRAPNDDDYTTELPSLHISEFGYVGVHYSNVYTAKYHLDVNGDGNINSKCILNGYRNLDWRAYGENGAFPPIDNTDVTKIDTAIFYNTRSPDIISGGIVQNHVFYFNQSTDMLGVPTNVTYNYTQKALVFNGSSSNVATQGNIRDYNATYSNNRIISLWFKITSFTATDSIVSLDDKIRISVTPGTIVLTRGGQTSIYSHTFSTGTWYHLAYDVNYNATQVTKSILYINNTVVGNDTSSVNISGFPTKFIVGDGITGYVGSIFLFGPNNRTTSAVIEETYNYGPPDEVLAVGGGATIAGKVGVGVTNPTEALEVNGIIRNNNPRFYAYNNTGNATTSTGVLNAFNLTTVNTGNHYDTTLSRFTAPVDGVYEFKFSALHRYVSGVGSSELTFAKNGTLATIRGVGYTFVTATSDHDYNPAEIILELVKGDYIEPYIHTVASGTDIYYGGGLAHFSGTFLG